MYYTLKSAVFPVFHENLGGESQCLPFSRGAEALFVVLGEITLQPLPLQGPRASRAGPNLNVAWLPIPSSQPLGDIISRADRPHLLST